MKGRNKLFFALLTFLLVVIIVLVGIRTRDSDKQIKRWESAIKKREQRGVQDPQLRETVDKLEANLRARLTETFDLDQDPLDLVRVIKTRKFLKQLGRSETAESDTRMRLSATVLGEESNFAIIKYRAKSHMVTVGDMVGSSDYRVKKITQNKVILKRGGEVMVLETEPAPDTIAEREKLFGPTGENKPKITVKEVPLGNM